MTDRIGIGVLTRLVSREIVDDVLAETGKVEQRKRLLPARVVVYYVMAMCLFFGEAYEEVMRRLVGGLRYIGSWRSDWTVPTGSAISQARTRLGSEPLKALFERVAVPIATPGTRGGWYQSWRVMAIDGVVLDVADTPENDAEFGRSGNHLAQSPFPQLRVVGLLECGTHACVAARVGAYREYERQLAVDLVGEMTPEMLIIADRGFYSYDLWKEMNRSGAQFLWRVIDNKTGPELPVYELLPDGSYRSAVVPKSMRTAMRRGKIRTLHPHEIPVRVVDYQITDRDGDTIRLITSILDHEMAPAIELAALYQQRWEIELVFDEIKTHQMEGPRPLRSKLPDLVRQELWALLLTHYAIRQLITEAAEQIDDDPDRLSFIRTLRVIRRQVTDQAAFSPHTPD
jgi:hypothetical protein